MTRVYGSNGNSTDHGQIQACSAATIEANTPVSSEIDVDSLGAGDGWTVTHNGNGDVTRAVYFETIANEPGETSWPSGTATVRMTVSTGNSNIDWTATHMCRVNSSGVNQETWGSLTGQTTTLSAGEHSHAVSVSSLGTTATDDHLYIILTFTINGHGNQTVIFDDADSDITTPFPDPPIPSQQSVTASRIFRASLQPKIRM